MKFQAVPMTTNHHHISDITNCLRLPPHFISQSKNSVIQRHKSSPRPSTPAVRRKQSSARLGGRHPGRRRRAWKSQSFSNPVIWGFPKMVGFPKKTMGFPTKNDHFGVFWGYHHLRKHPFLVVHTERTPTPSVPPSSSGQHRWRKGKIDWSGQLEPLEKHW